MRNVLIAMLVAGMAASAAAVVVNRIVATIDGEPITLYEINQFVQRASRGPVRPDPAAALDAFITDKLVQKEIADKGIVVREADIDQYINGIKDQNALDDAKLQDALAAQGLTMESYRQQIREQIQKAQLINREIKGKVNITPEDVDRYYQAHLEEYATPEKVHVRHILLRVSRDASEAEVSPALTKAEELYRQLKGGADFAELARRVSEDPAAKDGGDLGWLNRGEMLEDFETAVAGLKPGQVSRPVRTGVGVHLIKLEERSGASHKPLDELASGIKDRLYSAALDERYEKWLTEELRKRHLVEIRE